MTTSGNFLKNIFYSMLGRAVRVVFPILLVPITLFYLKDDGYGVWVLASVFITGLTCLSMRSGASLTAFVAEYHTRGDVSAVNQILVSGFVFSLLLMGILAAAAFSLFEFIVPFGKIPPALLSDARIALWISFGIGVFFNFTLSVQGALEGFNRVDLTSKIQIWTYILRSAAMIVLLIAGFRLIGLVVLEGAIFLANGLLFWRALKKEFPDIDLSLGNFSSSRFFAILKYELNMLVCSASEFVNFNLDKYLLPQFLGVSQTALYDLGSKAPQALRTIPSSITQALRPETANTAARVGFDAVYQLYLRSSKYMLLAVAPLMIFAMISAPYLLQFWLKRHETEIVYTLIVLAAAYLFRTVNNCTTGVLQGLNAVRIQRIYSMVSLFLNVSLSIVFIKYMGFKGAALGTFLAIMLSEMFYLWYFHHSYGQSVLVYLKYVYGKILPAAVGAGVVTGFLLLVIPPPLNDLGRGMCFFLLCVSGILYAVLYVILLMRFRSLNIMDIGAIIGKFGGFFGKRFTGFIGMGR